RSAVPVENARRAAFGAGARERAAQPLHGGERRGSGLRLLRARELAIERGPQSAARALRIARSAESAIEPEKVDRRERRRILHAHADGEREVVASVLIGVSRRKLD